MLHPFKDTLLRIKKKNAQGPAPLCFTAVLQPQHKHTHSPPHAFMKAIKENNKIKETMRNLNGFWELVSSKRCRLLQLI